MADTETNDKRAARIRARNARFEKLPVARKRVAIARDVLAALRAKRLIAKQGTYLRVGDFDPTLHSNASLADMVGGDETCTVCVKGSVFVCAAKRGFDITFKNAYDTWEGEQMSATLGGVFSAKQLNTMERAFEDCGDAEVAEEMLGDVMRNVVRNDGRFKPHEFHAKWYRSDDDTADEVLR